MQLDLGATVRSADGRDMGVVRWLVCNAATGQVAAVVLEKGLLFHTDIEVPLAALQAETSRSAILRLSLAEAQALPPFEEAQYGEAPGLGDFAEGYAGLALPLTDPSLVSPAGGMPPMLPVIMRPDTDGGDDPIAPTPSAGRAKRLIEADADVVDIRGETVGALEDYVFDAEDGRPLFLTVRHGMFPPQRRQVAADAILSIASGAITVGLTKAEFEAGPEASDVPLL